MDDDETQALQNGSPYDWLRAGYESVLGIAKVAVDNLTRQGQQQAAQTQQTTSTVDWKKIALYGALAIGGLYVASRLLK